MLSPFAIDASGASAEPAVTPALSVVIPVYNGARTIGQLVSALSSLKVEGGLEIVLVNDGSPDDSDRVCRRLLESTDVPITYIEHARNYGEHNAVMTGLRYARGSFVITMDDDLQNPPEEVLRLFRACRDRGHDVVYTFYARKKHAWWRNLGSRFANWVADVLLDKPRGVYLSSFRCMNRLVVDGITRYEGPFPYVDGLIMQVTQRIGTLEVQHLPRAVGRSNYTLRRLVRLWLNLAFNFSLLPLRVAVVLGLAMAFLGLLGAVYVVGHALFGDPPTGWASTITVILLLSGVQLVMLGIIGEYLGRTFLTANRKPQGLIRAVERGRPPAAIS